MRDTANNTLTRYYHLIDICNKLLQTLDEKFGEDLRWQFFSIKVAHKLITHCKSLCFLAADTYFNETDNSNEANAFYDLPGIFGNVRIQIDSYSTLYHIFFDKVDWEIKRLRFDLWRFDSNNERVNLNSVYQKNELKELENIADIIESNSFYKSLPDKQQKRIFRQDKKSANWKFFPDRLKTNDYIIKWNDLFLNTGIEDNLFEKTYSFLSMYVHSNFYSVSHLSTLTKKSSSEGKEFAINLSSFLICFTIDDIVSKFEEGRHFVNKLENRDIEIIKSFMTAGRKDNYNKNFA